MRKGEIKFYCDMEGDDRGSPTIQGLLVASGNVMFELGYAWSGITIRAI